MSERKETFASDGVFEPCELPPLDSYYEVMESRGDLEPWDEKQHSSALQEKIEMPVFAINILDFAYTLMEVLERYPKAHKYVQEQANSYAAQFRMLKEQLGKINPRLLECHSSLHDFYSMDLVKDDDVLIFFHRGSDEEHRLALAAFRQQARVEIGVDLSDIMQC